MSDREIDTLTRLDDWQLKDSHQDLCGKTLFTGAHVAVGRIDDMLADTGEQRVVALVLEDNRLVNIDDVDVRDGQAFLSIDPAMLLPPAPGFDPMAVRRAHVPTSAASRG